MIRRLQGWLGLAVVGVALAWASDVQAQGYGYGSFNAFNAGAGPYNLYDNAAIMPHFSLYPPVYYSLPVPRTYGWSPFAYPPGMMTPEIETPKAPTSMRNPHAPATAPAERMARAPLTIENPFVPRTALADVGPTIGQPAGNE